MIYVNNLSKSFDEKILYNDLSFKIYDNNITVILGLNGTGKTTLLKEIVSNSPENIKSDFKKLFFLPQNVLYPRDITLFEYLITPFFANSFKWYISKDEKQKVLDVLEDLNLTERKDVIVSKLSSGELQIANIALALISDADCLLLDEPTSNLDLVNQIKILDYLKKITNHNKTCILTIHDLSLASRYGDYFLGISKNGNIFAEKDEFFTESNLEKIFGISFSLDKKDEKYIIQTNI